MPQKPKNLMTKRPNVQMQMTLMMIPWKRMTNLLILKMKSVKTTKRQRNAQQLGREGREGHGECCQHQAPPLALRDPGVQGDQALPDVQEHQGHHCDHPAQLRQQDLESHRLQGCLEGPWGLVDRRGRIGRHVQELLVHQEDLT